MEAKDLKDEMGALLDKLKNSGDSIDKMRKIIKTIKQSYAHLDLISEKELQAPLSKNGKYSN